MENKQKEQVPWIDFIKPKQERLLLMLYHLKDADEGDCQHHLPVPGTRAVVVCQNWAEEDCGCCGRPTCERHFSQRTITLARGRHLSRNGVLCLECARFSREHIEAIFALRLVLNELGE